MDLTISAQINDLAAALAKAQGEIRGAKKDSENPFFKSSYADLSSVWDACREPLSKHGLCVVQTTGVVDGRVHVFTMLAHASGQWIRGELPINPVKNDPQGVGSAITYARRYSLSAMVGICPDDDDGEAAMGPRDKPAAKSIKPRVDLPSRESHPPAVAVSPPPIPDEEKREKVRAQLAQIQKNEAAGIHSKVTPEQINELTGRWKRNGKHLGDLLQRLQKDFGVQRLPDLQPAQLAAILADVPK